MNQRFQNWFKWLITWEGTTFENDPDDPGGATKYGIDQRSHPGVNIRALTEDQAAAIYLESYWNKVHADELGGGVGEVLANIAVNCGYGRAVRWLQEATYATVDGVLGPQTLAKTKQSDASTLCNALLMRTENHYRSIAKGKLAKFLKGWLNRNNSLRDFVGGIH